VEKAENFTHLPVSMSKIYPKPCKKRPSNQELFTHYKRNYYKNRHRKIPKGIRNGRWFSSVDGAKRNYQTKYIVY